MGRAFENGRALNIYADLKQGMSTANNDLFLRLWFEVDHSNISYHSKSAEEAISSQKKWFPHTKGGGARKWYGNNEYLVNWYNDGEEIRASPGSAPRSAQYYFREGLAWSTLSSDFISFRYTPVGYTMNTKGSICYLKNKKNLPYIFGLLNSNVAMKFLELLAPTLDYSQGPVGRVPVIEAPEESSAIQKLVDQNVSLSRSEWDSYETSWDFLAHPLVVTASVPDWSGGHLAPLADCYAKWKALCEKRFYQLKANEEELNRIFIDIYGLHDELSPGISDEDVTIRLADKKRDIKSLISYAVGCMFGRYSLDEPGLVYAGGEWDDSKYITFKADKDSIIPICDDEYFTDDIVGRFVRFIEVALGKATLDENLRFVADALGGSGQPKDVIRRYFMDEFYADHLKTYQKRPIYWLFDSGKKGGFRALVYMHRYQPDTIARVHEQQSRYRTAIADLEQRIVSASTSERVKLSKRLKILQEQAAEIQGYEEKIHHLADQYIAIDLDDGVKKNYTIFGDVLAKIK